MINSFAAVCFFLAIIHTFTTKQFHHLAHKYPRGSASSNFFNLLAEIEVVFGVWAAFFLISLSLFEGSDSAIRYLESLDFKEPIFVFVIMSVCSTQPILTASSKLIELFSRILPLNQSVAFYFTCMVVGPLLGSFITEPASMTVTALILLDRFYKNGISTSLKYATLGLLFVNISVGGTLTPFAAPPVLMVADRWNWNLKYMFIHFGWKALLSILISTFYVTFRFQKELSRQNWLLSSSFNTKRTQIKKIPFWVTLTHLFFLGLIILNSHHPVVFLGVFLFFLGLTAVTHEHQEKVKLRESLLVAFFLGGLVVLGGPQRWWLEPILTQLNSVALYLGSMSLTAITDNAALTYLGSQIPSLSESSRYALVAGTVVGGGLTVIANAPNPAGFGILNTSFGKEGISPWKLFINALPPTMIAAFCFWFLK